MLENVTSHFSIERSQVSTVFILPVQNVNDKN